MRRPLIGIVLAGTAGAPDGFSAYPQYALRGHYFEAIYRAGGLPVGLPWLTAGLPDYLKRLDGVVAPGGDYPFPDEWYTAGSGPRASPYAAFPSGRAAFDAELITALLAADRPLLGVCAGMQALAAVCGCRLTNRAGGSAPAGVEHRPADWRTYRHEVSLPAGTRLREILGVPRLMVNSAHNEAIAELSAQTVINARAPDGVIEGIEIPGQRLALGVQWHPELLALQGDPRGNPHFKLFQALVQAARRG